MSNNCAQCQNPLPRVHECRELGGEAETDTWVESYIRDDVPLPRGARIRFGKKYGGITAHLTEDGLEICGDHLLAVHPRSANYVVVKVVSRLS